MLEILLLPEYLKTRILERTIKAELKTAHNTAFYSSFILAYLIAESEGTSHKEIESALKALAKIIIGADIRDEGEDTNTAELTARGDRIIALGYEELPKYLQTLVKKGQKLAEKGQRLDAKFKNKTANWQIAYNILSGKIGVIGGAFCEAIYRTCCKIQQKTPIKQKRQAYFNYGFHSCIAMQIGYDDMNDLDKDLQNGGFNTYKASSYVLCEDKVKDMQKRAHSELAKGLNAILQSGIEGKWRYCALTKAMATMINKATKNLVKTIR